MLIRHSRSHCLRKGPHHQSQNMMLIMRWHLHFSLARSSSKEEPENPSERRGEHHLLTEVILQAGDGLTRSYLCYYVHIGRNHTVRMLCYFAWEYSSSLLRPPINVSTCTSWTASAHYNWALHISQCSGFAYMCIPDLPTISARFGCLCTCFGQCSCWDRSGLARPQFLHNFLRGTPPCSQSWHAVMIGMCTGKRSLNTHSHVMRKRVCCPKDTCC